MGEATLLVIAMAFFLESMVVDALWHRPVTLRYLLEDGAKLLGVVTWAVLYVRLSLREIRSHALIIPGSS